MYLIFFVNLKTEFLRVFVSVFYLAPFSVRRRNSVYRVYKKSSTLPRVVGLGIPELVAELKLDLGSKSYDVVPMSN